MTLQAAQKTYLPRIEQELRDTLATPHPALTPFYGMMQYHLGWTDPSFTPLDAPTGKRIRPLLCLLSCEAAGADPTPALPAAASLELLHNFSLIHDDIEDNSDTRRHRPTVWSLWGQPQAINVGDGMLAIAYLTLSRLSCVGVAAGTVLMAIQAFQEACLTLTEGQYLDMSFETRFEITRDEYLWMIHDKTAALLSTACRLGALLAGAENELIGALREFGAGLGMAFQIQDDILGIWGDEARTGKPTASDIRQHKKSLPFVYLIERLKQAGDDAGLARLRAIYAGDAVSEAQVAEVLGLLETAGVRAECEALAARYQQQALEHLSKASRAASADAAGIATLRELAGSLLGRQS